MEEYRLGGVVTRRIREGDTPLLLHVAVPEGAVPANGWPLVLLCDATESFATMVETVRRCASRPSATGIGPAIVAGLGYDRDAMDAAAIRSARQFDYSFGPAVRDEEAQATSACHGGGDALLGLIADDVLPFIAANNPVDRNRISLFGHSLVGKFVLDALVRRPDPFDTFVAISPSIWWDRPALEQMIGGLSDKLQGLPPRRVMIAVGEWEEGLAPWQQVGAEAKDMAARRDRRRMIGNVREIGVLLEQTMRAQDQVEALVFPDEDHASVIGIAYNRGLRFSNLHAK